ncbi:unnamed protein product [Protopolystoma xenopodis]|uniref:Uncharacterized protein n=1 Tax=Protopolystoma xenopodis TaxID=117903 RepID=A0A448XJN2_9PLAT|nr:unnamed protein product [Protopolystoma xenopodis]
MNAADDAGTSEAACHVAIAKLIVCMFNLEMDARRPTCGTESRWRVIGLWIRWARFVVSRCLRPPVDRTVGSDLDSASVVSEAGETESQKQLKNENPHFFGYRFRKTISHHQVLLCKRVVGRLGHLQTIFSLCPRQKYASIWPKISKISGEIRCSSPSSLNNRLLGTISKEDLCHESGWMPSSLDDSMLYEPETTAPPERPTQVEQVLVSRNVNQFALVLLRFCAFSPPQPTPAVAICEAGDLF